MLFLWLAAVFSAAYTSSGPPTRCSASLGVSGRRWAGETGSGVPDASTLSSFPHPTLEPFKHHIAPRPCRIRQSRSPRSPRSNALSRAQPVTVGTTIARRKGTGSLTCAYIPRRGELLLTPLPPRRLPSRTRCRATPSTASPGRPGASVVRLLLLRSTLRLKVLPYSPWIHRGQDHGRRRHPVRVAAAPRRPPLTPLPHRGVACGFGGPPACWVSSFDSFRCLECLSSSLSSSRSTFRASSSTLTRATRTAFGTRCSARACSTDAREWPSWSVLFLTTSNQNYN